MKKLILSLLLLIPSLSFADTATTGNPKLILISTGSVDRTRSWGDKVNENFSMISSSMAGLLDGTINMDLTGSTQTKLGGAIFGGDVTATKFHGDGSGLSGVATSGASTGIVLAGLLASTYTYTSVSTLSVTFANSSDLFIVAYASSIVPTTYGLNPVLTFRFNGDGGAVYTSQFKTQASSFTVEYPGEKNPYYSRNVYMKTVNNNINTVKNIYFNGSISSSSISVPDNIFFNGIFSSTSQITSVQMFTSWAHGKLGANADQPSFIEVYQMGGISTSAISGIEVADEELPVVSRATQFNFKGDGVSVAANGSTATITITGGGTVNTNSTYTWTASQTFQSSVTFSSTSLSIGGQIYHFPSTAPANSTALLYDSGGKVFWGARGGTGGSSAQTLPLIAGDTGYFSIYSTNTISATQTFQSSVTFSSTSLSIGGNLYHFQSSAPAVNTVLRYDAGGKVFWGNDGGSGSVDQSSTYTWTGTHNYKGRIVMQNATPIDDLTVTPNLYSLTFAPVPANGVQPAIYGFAINTGNIPAFVGHAIGVLGRSSDTENGHTPLFGVEGRNDIMGDSVYRGVLGYNYAKFHLATGSTATLYGIEARSEVFGADGVTPNSTATVASVYIPAIVGGASDRKWSIFQSGLTDPAYFGSPVGIGVQRPFGTGTKLHIGDASNPTMIIADTDNGVSFSLGASGAAGGYTFVISTTSHPLLFGVNNSEAFRVDTAKNVGINTTAPTQKMSVVGTVDVSSMMVYGTVTSTSGFVGDGSKLTGITASAAQSLPLIGNDTGYYYSESTFTSRGSLLILSTFAVVATSGLVTGLDPIFAIATSPVNYARKEYEFAVSSVGLVYIGTSPYGGAQIDTVQAHNRALLNIFPEASRGEVGINVVGNVNNGVVNGLTITNQDTNASSTSRSLIMFKRSITGSEVATIQAANNGNFTINGAQSAWFLQQGGSPRLRINTSSCTSYNGFDVDGGTLLVKNSGGGTAWAGIMIGTTNAKPSPRESFVHVYSTMGNLNRITDLYVSNSSGVVTKLSGDMQVGSSITVKGNSTFLSSSTFFGGLNFRELGSAAVTNIGVDTDGNVFQATSSKRYKKNIKKFRDLWNKILEVEPKSFEYKSNGSKDIGYIAEDFDKEGLNDLVNYNKQGQPESIKYDRIAIYLTEIIKDQEERLQRLENLIGIK